jgi:hypothetical protein
MPQWEYRKIDLSDLPPRTSDIDLLNEAGKEAWELVNISINNFAYLKRPVNEPAPAVEAPARQPARRRAAAPRTSGEE